MFLRDTYIKRLPGGLLQSAAVCALFAALCGTPAFADTGSYAMQQALANNQHYDLFTSKGLSGLKIGSSYFSGSTTGVNVPATTDNFGYDQQQMYALLVDGRYDFNHESSAVPSSSLHPYLMGGMGVAHTSSFGGNSLDTSGSSTVPLFRVGGGVTYRLDQRWDMSLDYKAGMAAPGGGDVLFTGRGQQEVDMQTLNVGMHYAF